MEKDSLKYFENLPYNEWILIKRIPQHFFLSVFEVINSPHLRPWTMILENEDFTEFMKVERDKPFTL